ncbi:hypothetical protein B0H11DRAFT_2220732 [Mycena galericulata]|nr:hypothetical protein B0H11DRAFT_2220732 [Mycena galericulata]
MASPTAVPQGRPFHPYLREEYITSFNPQDLPAPERRPVVRPQDDDSSVKTPGHIWIIPNARDSQHLPSASWDIMRRYCGPCTGRREPHNWSGTSRSTSIPWTVDGIEHKTVLEDQEAFRLRISDNTPGVCEQTVFPNPFKDPQNGHMYRNGSALIITGLSGIGKTLFLAVIFHLRVAAGLPTAYMRSKDVMLVYNGQQLFLLHKLALVQLAVPSAAWVLLDSNADLVSPPQDVADCDRFIVQAAAPWAGRTAWADKVRGTRQFCLMRPWTLEELFAGSFLQTRVCSGVKMRDFFDTFGGSARHIYRDSHNLALFETLVDASARLLDEGKLLDQLNTNIHMARRELYIINAGVATPGCKATAGDLLDKHHHEFIALGGKWRLRQFTKEDSDWVLEANSQIFVFRAPLTERPRRWKPEFAGLTMSNLPSFNQNVTQLAKNYYYLPSQTNFPTINSFYLDRKDHGLRFQAMDGEKRPHIVNDVGHEWLEKRGIIKLTYILVTGPNIVDPPSISVPQDHERKFDHFFYLVLEYPEQRVVAVVVSFKKISMPTNDDNYSGRCALSYFGNTGLFHLPQCSLVSSLLFRGGRRNEIKKPSPLDLTARCACAFV